MIRIYVYQKLVEMSHEPQDTQGEKFHRTHNIVYQSWTYYMLVFN
jgi:hypothetical protein